MLDFPFGNFHILEGRWLCGKDYICKYRFLTISKDDRFDHMKGMPKVEDYMIKSTILEYFE